MRMKPGGVALHSLSLPGMCGHLLVHGGTKEQLAREKVLAGLHRRAPDQPHRHPVPRMSLPEAEAVGKRRVAESVATVTAQELRPNLYHVHCVHEEHLSLPEKVIG